MFHYRRPRPEDKITGINWYGLAGFIIMGVSAYLVVRLMVWVVLQLVHQG